MNTLNSTLEQLGLTETEIKIYQTGLNLSVFGVAQIQKQTNLKRPTIYNALHSLQEKGLVAKSPSENILRFVCSPPERVVKMLKQKAEGLEQQAESLNKILPFLKQKISPNLDTLVTHYEGVEGIKTAVDLALYSTSKEWLVLAPKSNFFSKFDKEYAKYYLETRKRRKIKSRTLWEKDLTGRKLTAEELQERNPRYLPDLMRDKFSSMIIIYDDSVLVLTSLEKNSAIIIKSDEISDLFKTIFECLWSVSEEYI